MKTVRAIATFADWRILAIGRSSCRRSALRRSQPRSAGPRPATGKLILEGKHIEKLILSGPQGRQVLTRPAATVSLPLGQYVIEQIELEGGYTTYPNLGPYADRLTANLFTLVAGKPYRSNIGAPLNPSVTVKRAGRLLTLDYQLLDGDGRKYRRSGPLVTDESLKPKFAVYQGDRLVGSGSFEYG